MVILASKSTIAIPVVQARPTLPTRREPLSSLERFNSQKTLIHNHLDMVYADIRTATSAQPLDSRIQGLLRSVFIAHISALSPTGCIYYVEQEENILLTYG